MKKDPWVHFTKLQKKTTLTRRGIDNQFSVDIRDTPITFHIFSVYFSMICKFHFILSASYLRIKGKLELPLKFAVANSLLLAE